MANLIPVTGTPGLVNIEGEYIAVKPLCEALGLDYSAQHAKLKNKSWAVMGLIPTTGSDGKTYKMSSLHKDSVPMWLANIDENRVKPEVKPTLIAYQKEVTQALSDYFTTGVAVNTSIITDYKAQMEIISLAKGILPEDRLASRAELVIARAMGEKPQIAPENMPLYVETYLSEHGRSDIHHGGFGKKIANLYRNTTGEEPPEEPAMIQGRMRTAKAYKESHRPLFDQVLATYPAK